MGSRNPFGLFGDEVGKWSIGGPFGYLFAVVVIVVGIVVLAVVVPLFDSLLTVLRFWLGVSLRVWLGVPGWAGIVLILAVVGVFGFGGLYAALQINDWRRRY